MRLLIIGASGFLGSHVRHQAVTAGLEVITAGRARAGPAGWCHHQRLDLAADEPARIAVTLGQLAPDAVVNCAGATAGDPGELAAVNVSGTYALVRAIQLAGRPGRLVHLGSAAEYGPTEPGIPVHEEIAPRPSGMYGVTKLAGTRLVQVAVAGGLDGVVLRVFNPVGPGAPDTSLPGRLAAELRRSARRGTDVRLGALDAVRDLVDVRDVAGAVLAAATAPAVRHPVINVGSGRGVPVRDMAKELHAISGCAGSIREDAPGLPRPSDIPWQQADITRAAEDLGWAPHRDLATSLADLWEAIH
jgi:NDP-hexose 4-ketoreductase